MGNNITSMQFHGLLLATVALATGCKQPGVGVTGSEVMTYAHDQFEGYKVGDSPYTLLPGTTIAVCDTGVVRGVAQHVMNAVGIWLTEAGRPRGIQVIAACEGDRVIRLVPRRQESMKLYGSFYGLAHPLKGNVHEVEAAPNWAGSWTANHEIGHVFGFGHSEGVISIMNTNDNGGGRYMNGGLIANYDRGEIKKLLALDPYKPAVIAWSKFAADPAAMNAATRAAVPPAGGPAAPQAGQPLRWRLGVTFHDMAISGFQDGSRMEGTLLAGDVIQTLNGAPIDSVDRLIELLRQAAADRQDDKIVLAVMRQGQTVQVSVKKADLLPG